MQSLTSKNPHLLLLEIEIIIHTLLNYMYRIVVMSVIEIIHVYIVDEFLASYAKMMKSSAAYRCAATVHLRTHYMSPNTVVIWCE